MPTNQLSPSTRGWLRFLHRKATTPDDWSSAGRPASWWDDRSTPPVLNFPRFDLSESSYAIPMMADVTPAWREVYVEIMDGLLARHTTHWAAIDWLTQIGHDPDRGHYPQEYVDLWLPKHLVGRYDMPGWTANGVEPWGLAPDPVGAEGNLFFKGWFNLMLGFHAYVSRDRRWNEPFTVTGLDDQTFSWTHDGINALLVRQWTRRPEGPHCENTKIWPYCLSAAGLGLLMHDHLTGRQDHWVYDRWLEIARQRFLGLTPGGRVEWMALYHDPLENYTHRAGPTTGLSVAIYLLPQDRDLAEILYRTAVDKIGWSDPARLVRTQPDPRFLLLGLVLAREFGDEITLARLTELVELRQIPTVSNVDFPNLGIAEAWNEQTTDILHIGTYAATASQRRAPTAFRITQLPDASTCVVRCDGAPYPRWRATDAHSIQIDLDIDDQPRRISNQPTAGMAATNSVGISGLTSPTHAANSTRY